MTYTCPICRRELFDPHGDRVPQNGRRGRPSDDLEDFIVPDDEDLDDPDGEYVDYSEEEVVYDEDSEEEEESSDDGDEVHMEGVEVRDVETVAMLALEDEDQMQDVEMMDVETVAMLALEDEEDEEMSDEEMLDDDPTSDFDPDA